MEAAIKTCTCKHTYQDKLYGRQHRVCNPVQHKTGSTQLYRCTVCGSIK